MKMLDRITEGDTIVIESLSRLGRSTKDLFELVELFEKKKVHLVSLKESITIPYALKRPIDKLVSYF